jgi:hypothetical protein
MNHSIYSADRSTHLKIVVVGLAAAVVMTGLALSLHVNSNAGSVTVLEAGQPIVLTSAATTRTR